MKGLSSYLIRLLVFSILLFAALYLITPYFPEKFRFHAFGLLQLFFVVATFLFHYGLVNAAEKSNQAFVRFYMGGTGIRLFVFMAVIIVYALLGNADRVAFIMNFFLFYLCYTVFEVAVEYKKFSSMKGSGPPAKP